MCGRYTLTAPKKYFSKIWSFKDLPAMQPNYNIPPGVKAWGIKGHDSEPKSKLAQFNWGLVPSWAKDKTIGNKLINARSETVTEKPSFRDAFEKRRCLIPADGFFEWKRNGKERKPYYIRRTDLQPFSFAGLWDKWMDKNEHILESCTILTTRPNSLMENIHDRMPVILNQSQSRAWLDNSASKETQLNCLQPWNSLDFKAIEVSSLVNSTANNSAQLIEPWKSPQLDFLEDSF